MITPTDRRAFIIPVWIRRIEFRGKTILQPDNAWITLLKIPGLIVRSDNLLQREKESALFTV